MVIWRVNVELGDQGISIRRGLVARLSGPGHYLLAVSVLCCGHCFTDSSQNE